MKYLFTLLSGMALGLLMWGSVSFASTIITTNSSDTLGTFRTNVNTSLTNLNTDVVDHDASIVATSSALVANQILYATAINTMAGIATSSMFGPSTGGMVLGWNNTTGNVQFVATSTPYSHILPDTFVTTSFINSSTTVMKATLAANTLGSNGVLRLKAFGSLACTGGGPNEIDVGFGTGTTTVIGICPWDSTFTGPFSLEYIFQGNNATNAQKSTMIILPTATSSNATNRNFATSTTAIDTTANQTLYIIGKAQNTNYAMSFYNVFIEVIK